MAGIRVATVSYDWHELELNPNGRYTIGEQVDRHIQTALAQGRLLLNVTVEIEEAEANRMLREMQPHGVEAEIPTPKKR